MATLSKAEKKRRLLVQKLIKHELLPPKLDRPDIYAHADVGQLPYAWLPQEGDRPWHRDESEALAPVS